MTKKDLNKFLNKINQLNLLANLIKKDPKKRKTLSKCKSHKDVIKLTKRWGFQINKRWGE